MKEQEDKEINDETDLQRLRDQINSGHTPSEFNFILEVQIDNFS